MDIHLHLMQAMPLTSMPCIKYKHVVEEEWAIKVIKRGYDGMAKLDVNMNIK